MNRCEGCDHCEVEPVDVIQPAHSAKIEPSYKTVWIPWCLYYNQKCEEVIECSMRDKLNS
jgi:hypothetical protein